MADYQVCVHAQQVLLSGLNIVSQGLPARSGAPAITFSWKVFWG